MSIGIGKLKSGAIAVVSVGVVMFGAAQAGLAAFAEDFDTITPGTSLHNVTGWSRDGGSTTDWPVTSAAGYSGNGASVPATGAYSRTLTGSEIAQAADGPQEFRAKIRLVPSGTEDRFGKAHFWIAESGGVNAMVVRFDGGSSAANSTDNTIQVSASGASWGSFTYTAHNARWQHNTWYQVVITDIGLSTTGTGQSVSGKLSVYPVANPATPLLDEVAINGIGTSAGAFDQINQIRLQETGSPRGWQVDDVSLTTVPEPAAASVFLVTASGLLARRRRSQPQQ